VKDPSEDEKSSSKSNLEEIRDYFSDNKEINWDRLTTDMTYDDDQWTEISSLFWGRAYTMIKDVLKLPIKVF
jgi:hypothetical protein